MAIAGAGSIRNAKTGLIAAGGLLVLCMLLALAAIGQFRLALAGTILAFLTGLSMMSVKAGLFGTLTYLAMLGEGRRLLISMDGWPALDPLLMVGPAMLAVLVVPALAKREVRLDTALSKAVALLMAVMILQIFNPRQGPLIVGVSGALFYLVPITWFWVGRNVLTSPVLKTLLYRFLLPLGIVAALYGLYQSIFGYLPHQMAWYYIAGYLSLGPIEALKPVSFFASSTEHAIVLSVGAVIMAAGFLRGQKGNALLFLGLFACVFIVGSRGPVVRIVAAAAALWAILSPNRSTWILRGLVGLVIGAFGLYWSSTQVAQVAGDGAIGFYVDRQAGAFANPLDKKESTATIHGAMFMNGIRRGVAEPLGHGLGYTTTASVKFGSDGFSSEVDISNLFLSGGVVGGLIYLVIVILVARTALFNWQRDRGIVALCVSGILLLTVGEWLHGMAYFMSTINWLLIGALDGAYSRNLKAAS